MYLLLIIPTRDSIPPYTAESAYQDSADLYKKYLTQIDHLKAVRTTDTADWNFRALHLYSTICKKKKNLGEYNKTPYEPDSISERPGCEPAYRYPKPSEREHKGVFIESGPKLHYVVYDEQTQFIIDTLGKTRYPYITKTVYDKGRIILVQKLNPVTLDTLEIK